MKMIGVLLVGLLAGLCWPQPASAQDLPPGSYLGSCRNVYLQGDTLIATCRRADDDYSARPTALLAVRNCVGDIGNVNGTLTCNSARAPITPPQPYFGAPGNAPRPDGSCPAPHPAFAGENDGVGAPESPANGWSFC